jgi:hypothetical protein
MVLSRHQRGLSPGRRPRVLPAQGNALGDGIEHHIRTGPKGQPFAWAAGRIVGPLGRPIFNTRPMFKRRLVWFMDLQAPSEPGR